MNLVNMSRDLRFHRFPASAVGVDPKAGTKKSLPVDSRNGATQVRALARRGVSHASAADERSWASSCLAKAPPAEAPAGAMTAPSGPVRPSSAALAKTSAVADGPLLCLRRSWSGAAGMTRADKSSTGCHPGLGKALASRSATSRRARQAPSTGGAGKGRVGLGRVWPCDHRTGDHRPAPSRRGGQARVASWTHRAGYAGGAVGQPLLATKLVPLNWAGDWRHCLVGWPIGWLGAYDG